MRGSCKRWLSRGVLRAGHRLPRRIVSSNNKNNNNNNNIIIIIINTLPPQQQQQRQRQPGSAWERGRLGWAELQPDAHGHHVPGRVRQGAAPSQGEPSALWAPEDEPCGHRTQLWASLVRGSQRLVTPLVRMREPNVCMCMCVCCMCVCVRVSCVLHMFVFVCIIWNV